MIEKELERADLENETEGSGLKEHLENEGQIKGLRMLGLGLRLPEAEYLSGRGWSIEGIEIIIQKRRELLPAKVRGEVEAIMDPTGESAQSSFPCSIGRFVDLLDIDLES